MCVIKQVKGVSRSHIPHVSSCTGEMPIQEGNALHFSGSSHSHLRFDELPPAFSQTWVLQFLLKLL